jgi:glutathione synthase
MDVMSDYGAGRVLGRAPLGIRGRRLVTAEEAKSGLAARHALLSRVSHAGCCFQEPGQAARTRVPFPSGRDTLALAMRICFVVNSVRTQRPTYTTAHLASAAHRRGHDVALVSVDDLSHGDDRIVFGEIARAEGTPRDTAEFVRALLAPEAPCEHARLNDFDVIFLRNNPHATNGAGVRFNPAIEFGRRLKQAGVMVVNDPDGLMRAGSKMYLAGFPTEIRPRTLTTRSAERVRVFLRELDGPAVIKPLYGYGGQNVFFLARGETANLAQIISTVQSEGYVVVQEYLPAAEKGDKRVLMVGGVALQAGGRVAAYRRVHPKDDMRNNMHLGAVRRACKLSAVERGVCDLIRPRLVADGLYFVGVDIVGDKILEINVFAPGGISNMNELYGIDLGDAAIADLERKVKSRGSYHEPVPPHVFMRG